jgi:Response regulator containing CheY-like receiver, AAA-type ATPase, and DNA-binding domains
MANTRSAAAIVLLVDDESPVREVQRRALELDGYVVEEAGSGLEGIAAIKPPARIDLLVADLEMPGLGGAEMVRQIRMIRPDLPVLYVTGYIDRLMDARPLWEGEAFLEKPFSVAGLREAVSLLLHGTLRR